MKRALWMLTFVLVFCAALAAQEKAEEKRDRVMKQVADAFANLKIDNTYTYVFAQTTAKGELKVTVKLQVTELLKSKDGVVNGVVVQMQEERSDAEGRRTFTQEETVEQFEAIFPVGASYEVEEDKLEIDGKTLECIKVTVTAADQDAPSVYWLTTLDGICIAKMETNKDGFSQTMLLTEWMGK